MARSCAGSSPPGAEDEKVLVKSTSMGAGLGLFGEIVLPSPKSMGIEPFLPSPTTPDALSPGKKSGILSLAAVAPNSAAFLLHQNVLNAVCAPRDSFMFVAALSSAMPASPEATGLAATTSACSVSDGEGGANSAAVKGRQGGAGDAGGMDTQGGGELPLSPLVLAAHGVGSGVEERMSALLDVPSSSKVEDAEVVDGFTGGGDRDADRGEHGEEGTVVDLMGFSPKAAASKGGSEEIVPAGARVLEAGDVGLGLASQGHDVAVGLQSGAVSNGEVAASAGDVVGGAGMGDDLLSFSPMQDDKRNPAVDVNTEFAAASSTAEKSVAEDDVLFALQDKPEAETAPLPISMNHASASLEGDACLQLVAGPFQAQTL